jgi:polyhydroxybutyrate depolymerase
MNAALLLCLALVHDAGLTPGDQMRRITVDGRQRSYVIHVPRGYDASKPAPVVLILHGAGMNGVMMALFSGLNEKADREGFLAVYPNGTGAGELLLTFNAGTAVGPFAAGLPDDVKFIDQLLNDLARRAKVDFDRVYATGMSNGGMMCYRLAAELSGRIAAIAPVAGTMGPDDPKPDRPVPVLHFHGTADTLVPYDGPGRNIPRFIKFRSVEETIATWAELNGCPTEHETVDLPDRVNDDTTVRRRTYGPGKHDSEVVLYSIDGGGHTWPGRTTLLKDLLGRATEEIPANDLIWEFFQKHPRPKAPTR